MYQNLFYDKFAGDHHFKNEITSIVGINDLEDGSYHVYSNDDALNFYNQKFPSTYSIPEYLFDCNLYKLKIYTKQIEGFEVMYTVIGVNIELLEYYVRNKANIPHIDFLKNLCRFHLAYSDSNYFDGISHDEKIKKNIEYITQKAMTPVDYSYEKKIADQKEITAELFNYQKA